MIDKKIQKICLILMLCLPEWSNAFPISVDTSNLRIRETKIADPVTPNELGLVDLSKFGLNHYCPSGKVVEILVLDLPVASGKKKCSTDTVSRVLVDQLLRLRKRDSVAMDHVKTLEDIIENQAVLITNLQKRLDELEN